MFPFAGPGGPMPGLGGFNIGLFFFLSLVKKSPPPGDFAGANINEILAQLAANDPKYFIIFSLLLFKVHCILFLQRYLIAYNFHTQCPIVAMEHLLQQSPL